MIRMTGWDLRCPADSRQGLRRRRTPGWRGDSADVGDQGQGRGGRGRGRGRFEEQRGVEIWRVGGEWASAAGDATTEGWYWL